MEKLRAQKICKHTLHIHTHTYSLAVPISFDVITILPGGEKRAFNNSLQAQKV